MEENLGSDFASLDFDFGNKDPVSCLLCKETFSVCDDPQPLLKHLLEVHKFVIGAPEEIADFRQYILYWSKLQYLSLKDYCIVYLTNQETGTKETADVFYLLFDKLPEDRCLRGAIKEMKLKYLTQQKEDEYRNKTFSRQCIYCQKVIQDGVANCFHHLTFEHGFSLGNPDNIVFGAQLLDLMDEKLHKLLCLYCEKKFKTHTALREHMRKKQHRSLNPKNKIYDRFYIINYLKPGTPWEEAKKERSLDRENNAKEFESSKEIEESLEEELQWTDWREDVGVSAICLFCPFTSTKVPSGLFHHMLDSHHFDLESATKKLNFYQKVKIINFVRMRVTNQQCIFCDSEFQSNEELLSHMQSLNHSQLPPTNHWDAPQYMIPAIENDGLLFNIDDNEIDDEDTSSVASSFNDEVVFPEDAPTFPPSILDNWKLRQEISIDSKNEEKDPMHKIFCSYLPFKCFFCAYSTTGNHGRSTCVAHMNSMHNFNWKTVFLMVDKSNQAKLINYIRCMTELGQCYLCRKTFFTKSALEEHRILEEHTHLPDEATYLNERWCSPTMMDDGFLLNTEDVIRKAFKEDMNIL